MLITLILTMGLGYCLYKTFRGIWWGPQVLAGLAPVSLIWFAAAGGPLAIPLAAFAVLMGMLSFYLTARY